MGGVEVGVGGGGCEGLGWGGVDRVARGAGGQVPLRLLAGLESEVVGAAVGLF